MKRALPWLLLAAALLLGAQSYRKVARLERAVQEWHGDLPSPSSGWWRRWQEAGSSGEEIQVASATDEARWLAYAAQTSGELEALLDSGRFPEAQRVARELSRRLQRWRPQGAAEATPPEETSGLLKLLQERVRRAPAAEPAAEPATADADGERSP